MAKVERSIVIHAPWQEVEEIATDGSRIAEWFAGVEEAQSDDVYPNEGGAVKLKYKSAGITFNLTQTVQEYEQGDYLLLKLDGMITGTSRWSYEHQGEQTTVNAIFDYDIPGGGLGKVLDKMLIQRMNTENLEKSLANLKSLVEG